MSELQDRVRGAKIFTTLDLDIAYHLLRIKKGDEWKTAFRCRYGLYKFMVMLFGLTNAPARFQDMMNHILKDLLDEGVVVYNDDVLIYAQTEEKHDLLVKEVLKILADNDLVISSEKCTWTSEKVEFLGYVITPDGMEMAKEKIEAIKEWQAPQSLRDKQSFFGFANFYLRFIKNFSKICRPLTESTKGERMDWHWTSEMQESFEALKERFTTAPMLRHFDPTKTCIFETDMSDFTLGAILSQQDEDGWLYPIAFHSRQFQAVEINHDIHDKELLTVVDSFNFWRRYLDGVLKPVMVYSDHQNLKYFTTTKVLNRRQACGAQELGAYDFKIVYRPGSQNGKSDALSWHPESHPAKGGNEHQPIMTILSQNDFSLNKDEENELISSSKLSKRWVNWNKEFLEPVKIEGETDMEYQK
jgi:hypothetical protein